MANTAVIEKLNETSVVQIADKKSIPLQFGVVIGLAVFTVAVALGYNAAALCGKEFCISLPVNTVAALATAVIAICSGLCIKSGFDGSVQKTTIFGTLASIVLGALAFVAMV